MICLGLILMWCSTATPPATDSFCSAYQKVVQAAGDGAIKASDEVRRRIAANEIVYRCQCEGWKSPRCKA